MNFDDNMELRQKPQKLTSDGIFTTLFKCRQVSFGKKRFTASNQVVGINLVYSLICHNRNI